jgi:hypothetical protein
MRSTYRTIAVCCLLSAGTVALSSLSDSPPAVHEAKSTSKAQGGIEVTGVVRFHRGGQLNMIWWKKPLATRDVPFTLQFPHGFTDTTNIESHAIEMARRVTGAWTWNWAGIAEGWVAGVVSFAGLYLLVKGVRAAYRPVGRSSADAAPRDGVVGSM